jgi:flagellar basal-body rod modification protein FlgD
MKNEAFVAQLAQFSQLEGITNMSTSLSDVADVIRSDRIMSGANLVGKSVFGQTGRISTDGQSVSQIEVYLPYGAEQVDLGIYDLNSGASFALLSRVRKASGYRDPLGGMVEWLTARLPLLVIMIRGTATISMAQQQISVPSTFSQRSRHSILGRAVSKSEFESRRWRDFTY